MTGRLGLGTLLVAGLLAPGCDNTEFPEANEEVRIEEGRFFPVPVEVSAGGTVRWVNILPRSAENVRTVTSGSPEDSAAAGALFDVTLEGRDTGEVEGDAFTYRFNERGTFAYFSRNPETPVLKGTVIVR
jgi:plastocyanin